MALTIEDANADFGAVFLGVCDDERTVSSALTELTSHTGWPRRIRERHLQRNSAQAP